MSTDTVQSVASTSLLNAYERAYLALLAEAAAIDDGELETAPTDTETLSAAVFAKEPPLTELREDAEKLWDFDMHAYDALQPRTQALCHAESLYKMAIAPPPSITGKLVVLSQHKSRVLAECDLLVVKEVINPTPIEALRFNTSDRQVSANIRHVIVYLRTHWDTVAPHTTMTLEELAEFEKLAIEVHSALSFRDAQPKQISAATLVRKQMFTLVLRSLRAVERAVLYLRRDRQDHYLPDVYAKLGQRRDRAEETATPEPVVAPPVAPAEPAAEPVPVGMPGSNPFTR